jgi:hypothetical protein
VKTKTFQVPKTKKLFEPLGWLFQQATARLRFVKEKTGLLVWQ